MFDISPISIYNDNYVWVLTKGKDAWVVDPGLASPVIEHLEKEQLSLQGLVITHGHWDHISGVEELVKRYDIPVYGPDSELIPCLTHPMKEGSIIELAGEPFRVMETPGHVTEHIVYYSDATEQAVLLAGDTLFAMGCGRLFTGTMEQHFNSLKRISQLPATTLVYCTHEYTESNLKFALTLEPSNPDLLERQQSLRQIRQQNRPSIPTTIALELKTNPFLRCQSIEIKQNLNKKKSTILNSELERFTALRELKDNF